MRTFIAYLVLLLSFSHITLANSANIGPSLDSQINISANTSGADILWNKSSAYLEEDGHWRYKQYVSIRINDSAAARDYGRIAISFNHYYSDLNLDFANARSADGTITAVAEDAIQLRVTGGGQDFYSDSSELVFSLPDILPGSIIEFQYTLNSKQLALASLYSDNVSPFWFQGFVGGDGWRVDPVVNHEHSLSVPVNKTLHTQYFNGYPETAIKTTSGSRTTSSWEMRNLAGITYESWMAPFNEVFPQLSISSHTDWSIISEWTWGLTEDRLQLTPEIEAIAKSFLLADNASVDAKTKAVYAYMQKNIRYVFAHLGRGGYEPHFANEVVNSSYGDCKDQTILTVALLRALGVEAYPALVQTPRSGRHDTDLVAMIFDHMITYIPATENQAEVWLDTTGDSSLYPGISNYLRGQTALIIDSKESQLTKIDQGFHPNTVDMAMDYSLADNGDTLVNVDIALSGYFEQNFRNWWVHTNNRESDLQLMLTNLFGGASNDKVTTKASNYQDLFTPFSFSAQFLFPKDDTNEAISYGASFSQTFNLFGNFKGLQTPDSRHHRFVDHYGFSLYQRVNIEVPENHLASVLQSSGHKINPHFSLMQNGNGSDNNYYLELSLDVPKQNLSVEAYQIYFEGLEALTKLDPWVIGLNKNTANTDTVNDPALSENSNSLAGRLHKTRELIDQGEFESALLSAKTAVGLDEKSGEAWFLLGMAQGLNTLLDESNTSFETAAELGYLP